MLEKRDSTLVPEVQEWEEKLRYIMSVCDLMDQRRNSAATKVDIRGIVSEQVSELHANLEQKNEN